MSNPGDPRPVVTDDFIRGLIYAHNLARGEVAAHHHGGNVEGASGAQAVADKIGLYIERKKAQQADH